MITRFTKVLQLLIPSLWQNTANKLATTATLLIIITKSLVAIAQPQLLSYLLANYKTLTLVQTLLITIAFICCWYGSMMLPYLSNVTFFQVISQAIRNTRLHVITHMHQVPIEKWEQYNNVEIVSATTRISMSIRGFMQSSFLVLFPAIFTLITITITFAYLYPQLWYLPLLISLTYGYFQRNMRHFMESRRKVWEHTDHAQTVMHNSLQRTKWVRFHMQEEVQRLSKIFDREMQEWWSNNFQQQWIQIVQNTLFFLLMGALWTHAIILLRAQALSIAEIVAINSYLLTIQRQLHYITFRTRVLFTNLVDLEKVLDLLNLPIHTAQKNLAWTPETASTGQPILELRSVLFKHPTSTQTIFENASLTIRKGEHIALLGPSGIGKSTLCHLLAGLYSPQKGEVLLCNTPIQDLSLNDIGKYIHFIDQEASLINDTISTNINNKSANTLAHLKSRLHETTGDHAKKLSRGEQQRILLTHCLDHKPQILILDETFSALDNRNAQELLTLILQKIPTVILVTHQEALAKNFQHIYKLEQGQLQRT